MELIIFSASRLPIQTPNRSPSAQAGIFQVGEVAGDGLLVTIQADGYDERVHVINKTPCPPLQTYKVTNMFSPKRNNSKIDSKSGNDKGRQFPHSHNQLLTGMALQQFHGAGAEHAADHQRQTMPDSE